MYRPTCADNPISSPQQDHSKHLLNVAVMKNTNNGPTTIQANIRCHRRSPGDSAPQLQQARANAETSFPHSRHGTIEDFAKCPTAGPGLDLPQCGQTTANPETCLPQTLHGTIQPDSESIPPLYVESKTHRQPLPFETAHGQGSQRVMEVYILRLYRKLTKRHQGASPLDPRGKEVTTQGASVRATRKPL